MHIENLRQALEERSAPTPYYLCGQGEIGPVVRMEEGQRRIWLEGGVIFPKDDPTIASRGHVNHAHFLFAAWNASHLLAPRIGVVHQLSECVTTTLCRVTEPGAHIRMRCEAVWRPRDNRIVAGTYTVTFSTMEGCAFGKLEAEFTAQEAQ